MTSFSKAIRMAGEESYPRDLNPLEKDLLLWLLPADRPGYRDYRFFVESWRVAANGRRGEGNFILAPGITKIDIESPLAQVLAYGVVETNDGKIAATVRERLDDQLEFEIICLGGKSLPDILGETRRWTFSTWLPKQPCPCCSDTLREVNMQTVKGRRLVLALCTVDRKIWVYDEISGINYLIPMTNFYNELMLHTNVRDPKVALNSKRLFTDLQDYSDAMLSRAFASYNKLKTKIVFEDQLQITGGRKPSFLRTLRSRILKSS